MIGFLSLFPMVIFQPLTAYFTMFSTSSLVRLIPALSVSVSTILAPLNAQGATTVLDSLGGASDSGAFDFDSEEWRGPIFQAGPSSYNIQQLSFKLDNYTQDANFTLRLYALDGSNLPNTELASQSLAYTFGINTYNANQLGNIATIMIGSGQSYGLILSNPTSSIGIAALFDNDGSTNDYSFADGFGIAGDGYVESFTAGVSWSSVTQVTPSIALQVQEVPEPLTILGASMAISFGAFFKRRSA